MEENTISEGLLPARPLGNLEIRLTSIVEPLDWRRCFPQAQPVEVELGCGNGAFVVAQAQARPAVNFLGVERLLGRLRKADRRGTRHRLENLRILRIEAAYLLEYLLPATSIQALHVYFPDPWPKRRHHRRRLVNGRFTELARRVLAPAGTVFLRTDDPDYQAQMREVFAASPWFQPVATPPEMAACMTEFECDFTAQGLPIHRLAFQLKKAQPFAGLGEGTDGSADFCAR